MDFDDEPLPSPPGPPKEPPPSLPPPIPARPPRDPLPAPTTSLQHDPIDLYDQDCDNDEISQQMTASYSEISFKSGQSPEIEIPLYGLDANPPDLPPPTTQQQRPATLFGPLTLEGSVHVEGNMTHFVAENLEYKIKLSSPQIKKDSANSLYRQLLMPQIAQSDLNLLNDLECEAQRIAASIDSLTEKFCGILHSASSLTADNVDIYKNAVTKMSDAMDSNIKSMYTMMAKAEEISQAMQAVQAHSTRLKEIRKLVDLFESYI